MRIANCTGETETAYDSLFPLFKIAISMILAQATINTEKAACISILNCSQVSGSLESEKPARIYPERIRPAARQLTPKNAAGAYLVSPATTNYQIQPVMRLYGFIN